VVHLRVTSASFVVSALVGVAGVGGLVVCELDSGREHLAHGLYTRGRARFPMTQFSFFLALCVGGGGWVCVVGVFVVFVECLCDKL
jgi:hypothetical protein